MESWSSSLFFADQRLCSADVLPLSHVRARIQVAVVNFLRDLSSPTPSISHLPLISRKSDNSGLRRGLLSDVASVYLSHSFCVRSLTRGNDAKAFIRVWKVMEMCFRILGLGKQVTQRELFYKLLCDSPEYFVSQNQVNRTVQDVVALLCCSRQSLGIMASSRGAIVGRLLLQEPGQETIDCAVLGPAGYPITGDLDLLSKLQFVSDARYIIIVEKDAIFQRLAEDRLYNQLPCILITAKGYPDIATRFILHRLSQTFPNVPILALVDWNPAGLAIVCTYKYGSINMGLEAYRYACNVKWLGLRGDDLQHIPQHSLVQLKQRDLQIAKSLMSSKLLQALETVKVYTTLPHINGEAASVTRSSSKIQANLIVMPSDSLCLETYKAELLSMAEKGHRAEIEALYCRGFDFLGKYIATKIVQSDYI